MRFSTTDYALYYLAKGLSIFFRYMPVEVALFIGRRFGMLFSLLNKKRYRIAYANLKAAFSDIYSPAEIKGLLKKAYANIGQGVVDVFLLPKINKAYIEKYITFEDFEIAEKVLAKGKGMIFLTAHFGTWEISHAALPYKGLAYKGIAREQKPYLLNRLLNDYRQIHGCRIVMKGPAIKEALRALRRNDIVGMLVDQDAGKNGIFTDLFGRPASWHRGVIEMALKTGAAIVPGFAIRERGPYIRFKIFPPLQLSEHLDTEAAVKDGLSQYARILEDILRRYPHQWLWQHRRWKSTPIRDVILLNDGRTGHLRQSEACLEQLRQIWQDRGYNSDNIRSRIIDVEFKNRLSRYLLFLRARLLPLYGQGSMRCLRMTLRPDSYKQIAGVYADMVISCGSSTAAVNLFLSRENNAKSIAIMKPGRIGSRHFDLTIVPKHDHPKQRDNQVITETALNFLNTNNPKEHMAYIQGRIGPVYKKLICLLIGGDTKNFQLRPESIKSITEQIIRASKEYDVEILVSTSRRTSEDIESFLKQRLAPEPRCRVLIIANEDNPKGMLEAMLGVSDIVIVSEDSISMISEAVSSRGYRIVFRQGDYKDKKHNFFIRYMAQAGYIETARYHNIYDSVKSALDCDLKQPILDESLKIKKALERII
jgi:Kdo2-lipid IVA lauroyltransferase/acyltransferase